MVVSHYITVYKKQRRTLNFVIFFVCFHSLKSPLVPFQDKIYKNTQMLLCLVNTGTEAQIYFGIHVSHFIGANRRTFITQNVFSP